jgi:hypothetical protein
MRIVGILGIADSQRRFSKAAGDEMAGNLNVTIVLPWAEEHIAVRLFRP